MGNKFLIGLLTLLCFSFLTPSVSADSNNDGCGDSAPLTPPILTSAKAGDKSVTLTWIEAQEPLTAYVLVYSTSEFTEEFGNPNVGGIGTTTYTVGELQNGVKYYFKLRGVHGCKPGKFSNKISAVPGSSEVVEKAPSYIVGPKLSIYKEVLSASTSAATKEAQKKPVTALASAANQPSCSSDCLANQLWIVEIVALILYFSAAKYFPLLRPAFSIFIPLATAFLFSHSNSVCSANSFSCKYFLPVDVTIFILMVVIYKQKFLSYRFMVQEVSNGKR